MTFICPLKNVSLFAQIHWNTLSPPPPWRIQTCDLVSLASVLQNKKNNSLGLNTKSLETFVETWGAIYDGSMILFLFYGGHFVSASLK